MIRRTHRGFTLVEMLTVIAIITLLIGILTPALTTSRTTAQRAAVKAQINAINTGCEMFRGDENEYPKSNDWSFENQNTAALERDQWEVTNLSGAHLIVDAMVGRDLLGYDPKLGTAPGTSSLDDRWYAIPDVNGVTRSRRAPYVKPEGISFSSNAKPPEDAFGSLNGITFGTDPAEPLPDNFYCPVFLDKFGFPILYYRANPRTTPTTPIIQSTAAIDPNIGDGFYDGRDNQVFTSARVAPRAHHIFDADQNLDYVANSATSLSSRFAEFIRSFRGSSYDNMIPPNIAVPRPVNADNFILLSPGKDGIYGNLDDVANFEVLSEER